VGFAALRQSCSARHFRPPDLCTQSDEEPQYINRRRKFEKARQPSLDDATIDEQVMREFDELWADPQRRLMLAPGKEVLATLNAKLQEEFKITVSPALIIECCPVSEIPQEMIELVNGLTNVSQAVVGDSGGGA
jgi:hypothetical protein